MKQDTCDQRAEALPTQCAETVQVLRAQRELQLRFDMRRGLWRERVWETQLCTKRPHIFEQLVLYGAESVGAYQEAPMHNRRVGIPAMQHDHREGVRTWHAF